MKKRILPILLVLVMMLTVVSCGSSADKNKTEDGFIFKGNSSTEKTVELGTPANKLDPAKVYDSLTYTPQMFYGNYKLKGGDSAEEKFADETEYFTWNNGESDVNMSKVPFRIEAGKNTLMHKVNSIKEHNWMRLSFMRKTETDNVLVTYLCSYTVEGKRLTVKPLDVFEVDDENNKINYSFYDLSWEFDFEFSGRSLTLKNGGSSVTLTAGLSTDDKDYFHADSYLCEGSKAANDIDHVDFLYNEQGNNRLYFVTTDDYTSYNSIAELKENGLFTFTLSLEKSAKIYQYVYFYCDRDGIILTDGTEVYYYNDSHMDRNKNILNEYLTEDQTGKLDTMTDSQVEAIVEKKENLMDDLAKAFSDAGIKVTVNQSSGEMAMDASVLFGGDSALLTAEGKELLNKFINAYVTIVCSDKYDGFVAKTMIEGHTAPLSGSTYESGLPLSQQRADNVKNYCISSETGVDTSKLSATMQAVGCSNSKPITDADGKVDLAACRRVSFRFIINLG